MGSIPSIHPYRNYHTGFKHPPQKPASPAVNDSFLRFASTSHAIHLPHQHNDPLRRYLLEIDAEPLLTAEEELALGREIQQGRKAMKQLIKLDRKILDHIQHFFGDEHITPLVRSKMHDALKKEATALGGLNALSQSVPSWFKMHPDLKLDLFPKLEAREHLVTHIERAEEARQKMIRGNTRLVVDIVNQYWDRGLSFFDLVGEGNTGLIHAVDEYDPTRGNKFAPTARFWINKAIKEALQDKSRTIRLKPTQIKWLNRWRSAAREMERTTGRPPRPEEVAKAINLPESKIGPLLRLQKMDLRTYPGAFASLPDEETGSTLLLLNTTGREADPLEAMAHRELLERLVTLLKQEDKRTQRIFTLRYGLNGDSPKTLKEVGDAVNLSHEMVRKIESHVLAKFQSALKEAD